MDYFLFNSIGLLLVFLLLILIVSSLLFHFYFYISCSHKELTKTKLRGNFLSDIRKNFFFKKEEQVLLNIILILYLLITIFLTFFIVDIYFFGLYELKFDLVLILICLFIPIFFSGVNYKSYQLNLSSKSFFSNIFNYFIPIILSIFSLIIFLLGQGFNLENLNLTYLIDLQIITSIKVNEILLPALFIIINPFSAIAFLTGLLGIFRMYRSDGFINNKINQKSFSKILRNISLFIFTVLFVFLFFGGGYFFGQNFPANISMNLIICVIIIIIIAFLDYERPQMFIERKVGKIFNIPMIFSIISLIYSAFLITFKILIYI